MYNVEDLIESTVEKMNKGEIIIMAQELYDEVEDGWAEDEREDRPETLRDSVEYLDIFGFMITKAKRGA